MFIHKNDISNKYYVRKYTSMLPMVRDIINTFRHQESQSTRLEEQKHSFTSKLSRTRDKCEVKIVSVVEVNNIRTYSHKSNKLRNVCTIRRGARNISIKKWKINYSCISKLYSQDKAIEKPMCRSIDGVLKQVRC